MNTIDLNGQNVVTARDVEAAVKQGATELLICEKTILTPSAQDLIAMNKLSVRKAAESNSKAGACGCSRSQCGGCPGAAAKAASPNGAGSGSSVVSPASPDDLVRLFNSAEAEAVKAEILAVGRKLWQRMYVDGNGGNISCRIGPNAVICTPTLISKFDMRPEDLCLVDMEGKQLLGPKARTSEILLHLEIYKNVPEAKAAVHCHPPHATAYAITGRVPPTCIIPEFEVFVGKVALSPYETPGTQKFAETVVPYVKNHNTLLLGNHGVICWADSVTHAEWCVEVLDTYCWTLMLTNQLGEPISYIPPEKASDLIAIKNRLGLPDVRLLQGAPQADNECRLCDMPDNPAGISVLPGGCPARKNTPPAGEVDELVKSVTDAVMAAIEVRK